MSHSLDLIRRLEANVSRALVGKPEAVRLAVVGLLARGHILVEGVPGLAKTMAIKTLAEAIGGEFKRIQFTPDLVPADLIGTRIYNQKTGEFTTSLGPVFTNLLLADEINRTTPKTQSSLLEAMNEAQVSLDHSTYPLPQPFMVLATQNPREHEGTYPLPESQLDRFLLRIRIGYPGALDEKAVLRGAGAPDEKSVLRGAGSSALETLVPVLQSEDVLALQEEADRVRAEESVLDYLMALVEATRVSPLLSLGVSPRGSLALLRAARAHALIDGRHYLVPDDVKRLAVAALAHRVLLKGRTAQASGMDSEAILRSIVQDVPVPR